MCIIDGQCSTKSQNTLEHYSERLRVSNQVVELRFRLPAQTTSNLVTSRFQVYINVDTAVYIHLFYCYLVYYFLK